MGRGSAVFMSTTSARDLAERALCAVGLTAGDAAVTADHLIDCELRGLGFSGLARILSIAERLGASGGPKGPVTVVRETPVSAQLDGGDNLGYPVARRATALAVEKAGAMGIALVGAHNTWYTGMLSYYAETAAREGLVTIIASNATPWVAPYGGTEARFGTNPVCIGFPSTTTPVIWDIGTSRIIHAQAVLARRQGRPLPPDVAYDADGLPTTDPVAALAGAFTAWGGHRGSGLGIAVQLLGIMAGSPALPGELRDFGFLVIALRPDLLGPAERFKEQVTAYGDLVRGTRPLDGGAPVRMPFDRSAAHRARQLARGGFEVPDDIHTAVTALATSTT
ncbi:Ldh family oxidoreductase [Streptomyces sp. NPDC026672]|uniref:Ldh family oxidoreductase n=1 Tax=unclassified Streptomyces TaxID=2593676 RepID=UPI0033DB1132